MKPLSKEQKAKTIKWLQKQRDGYIIGDYRNILYHIYQEIKSFSENDGYCTVQNLIREDSIHYKTETQVLELCDMLKELGYIDICDNTYKTTFYIVKPIDF